MSRGGFLAVFGGVIAIIAFFSLPYISIGLLGSYTGAQIAGAVASEGGSSGSTVAFFMWLIPLLGLLAAVIGGVIISRAEGVEDKPVRGLAITNIILGILGVGLLILPFLNTNSSNNAYGIDTTQIVMSFVGFGYWLSLLCMAAVLIGGISAATSKE